MGAGIGTDAICCSTCKDEVWDGCAFDSYAGIEGIDGYDSHTTASMPGDDKGEEIIYPLTKAFVDESVGIDVAIVNGIVVVTKVFPGKLVDRTNKINLSGGPRVALRTLLPRDVILSVNKHACTAREMIVEMRTRQMLCFQVLKLSLVKVEEEDRADTCSILTDGLPSTPGHSASESQGRAPWAQPPAVDRSPNAPYTNIQFVAYEICTAPPGFGSVGDGSRQFHLGLAGDLTEDIQHRLELLLDAMDQCYECDAVDHSPDTLKVFMAPEMFFRGTVDPCYGDIVLQALNNVWPSYCDSRFADWLCLFGTAIGRDAVDIKAPYDEACIVYNIVPVKMPRRDDLVGVLRQYRYRTAVLTDPQLGGLATGDLKRFMSVASHARITSKRKGSTPIVRDGIFTGNGVTFGHENCLDHVRQSLKRLSDAQSIGVQLLSTFACRVRVESIVASEGGYIFQCDGCVGSPVEGFCATSSLMRVNRGCLEEIPFCKRGVVHGTQWREVLRSLFVDTDTQPTVVIYPSMPVPPSAAPPQTATHPSSEMSPPDPAANLDEGFTCDM